MSVSNLLVPNNLYIYAGTLDTSENTANGGIIFPNVTPSPLPNKLSFYLEQSFVLSFIGPYSAPVNGTVHATRIGNLCTLSLNSVGVSGAWSQNAYITTSNALSSIFRPPQSANSACIVQNGSTSVLGSIIVGATGTLSFYVGLIVNSVSPGMSNAFTSGSVGVYQFSITYLCT